MIKTIYNDEDKANAFLIKCRWPKGIKCAYCHSDAISKHKEKDRGCRLQCSSCKKSFSVLTNTFLHGIRNKGKWLLFIELTNNGVYSLRKVSESLSSNVQTIKAMEERIYRAKKQKDLLLESVIDELSYVKQIII